MTSATPSGPAALLLDKLDGVKRSGAGYMAKCPAHEDGNASLSVSTGDDGRALVKCHAGCATEDVVAAVGLTMGDLFTDRRSYAIRDTSGVVVASHVRIETGNGQKQMLWQRPDGSNGLDGVKTAELPLYGSEDLAQWDASLPIIVVEGEKATDALRSAGFRALGTVTGAASTPSSTVLESLQDHHIILWPDNDKAGADHIARIGRGLAGVAASVRVVAWADAPDHGDAADLLITGTAAEVDQLIEDAQPLTPQAAEALDATTNFLRRYIVFANTEQADAVAWWVGHTWLFDQGDTTAYLLIQSPEKRSGKSRLLEALRFIVRVPVPMAGASLAALFRIIHELHPTLLLDEADTIFNKRGADSTEDIRGLLNNGYRRGVPFWRVVGDGQMMRPEQFDVFCPKAIASIRRLPDTVQDRAVVIALQRRARHEPIQRFRFRVAEQEGKAIREMWESLGELVLPIEVDVPDVLDDRAADSWEPLLALADAAGGDWPDRARKGRTCPGGSG